MHKRDYLVKQFEEFGKVMAILLGLKREGHLSEFNALINESFKKHISTEISETESILDLDLLHHLTIEKKLNDEQLKIVADLFYEKAEYYLKTSLESQATNCYKKAYSIYLFLKDHATLSYSLDMHYKLEVLSMMGL